MNTEKKKTHSTEYPPRKSYFQHIRKAEVCALDFPQAAPHHLSL